MKRLVSAASVALLFPVLMPVHAQTVDPLWTKALAQVQAAKGLVAQDTELVVDGIKDGKDIKKTIKSHLTGWDKGKPVYTVVDIEPKPDPSKPAPKPGSESTNFSSTTDELFQADAPVKRTDGQVLNGKTWTLFEIKKSDGPMDVTMKVWVDPESGVLLRTENHIHGTFMMDMQMNTTYVSQGRASVPGKTDMRIEVLIPFKGSKMHVVNNASNWIARPA
jgi:hypothetical protein